MYFPAVNEVSSQHSDSQATHFFCNRFPSEAVAVSIDLYITSTLNLQPMSKRTVLGVTQACSEVQRTQMEKEKQKCKICRRLPVQPLHHAGQLVTRIHPGLNTSVGL